MRIQVPPVSRLDRRLRGVLIAVAVIALFALAMPAYGTTRNVDSQTKDNAVAIGPDGYPIVAYYTWQEGLKVADCADSACTKAHATLTVVDTADGNTFVDMAIGSDGFPLIIYSTTSSRHLKLMDCGNSRCTPGLASITTVRPRFTADAAITVKANGTPFIAAVSRDGEGSEGNVYAIACDDPACTVSTQTKLMNGDSGHGIDVVIGQDGNAVFTLNNGSHRYLVRCGDGPCSASGATITGLEATGDPNSSGGNTGLVIGHDGYPIVVYRATVGSPGDAFVRLADCSDPDCLNPTITSLDPISTSSLGSERLAIELRSNGLPFVTYYESITGYLRLAECNTTDCSSRATSNITRYNGQYVSLALDNSDYAVMSYEESGLTVTNLSPLTGPDGSISGYVLDENGFRTPRGRAEVYTDTEFIGLFPTNNTGLYDTGALSADTYYVFLYNGDDEFFIDWFPEWYDNQPILKSRQAKPIVIVHDGSSVSNVTAELSPLYEDMWDSVFIDSIIWMQNTGITKGCAVDRYCPDDSVTRGQMAAFLVRALGLTDSGGGDLFTDDDNSIFEGAIDKLATAGVTKGCNPPANTKFCPDAHVTRGQMAAFLVRALGYTEDGGGDLFIDDDGHVFEGAIDKFAAAGVTKGCNPPANTMFCPDELVTRGQMAAFLRRALEDSFTASVQSTVGGPQQAIRR